MKVGGSAGSRMVVGDKSPHHSLTVRLHRLRGRLHVAGVNSEGRFVQVRYASPDYDGAVKKASSGDLVCLRVGNSIENYSC